MIDRSADWPAWPSATIVVTTYNGRAPLESCLLALRRLDYPRDRYRVVVVDNASDDGSAELVAERFPEVDLVRCRCNLGFAAGSNRGFARATSDVVVTLNNDTVVTPSWLAELVRPIREDPAVGLCTGKLLLAEDRLRVRLTWPPDRRSSLRTLPRAWLDGRPVRVERLGLPSPTLLDLGLAVAPGARPTTLRLALPWEQGMLVQIAVGDGAPRSATLEATGTLTLALDPATVIRPVIQNAGSLVFRDGRGRDRGAVAGPGFHYYQDDVGQFDRTEEVFAGCGASLLLRSDVLADVGPFDERFFLYYEDTDLSWRARLRGWKVVYAAGAVVRHAHRGSTGAWSGAFVYYTERNRLMMLLKLAPARRALEQCGRALAAATLAGLAAARRSARGQDSRPAWAGPRWAALRSLAWLLPGLLASRSAIQARRRVSEGEIERWLDHE